MRRILNLSKSLKFPAELCLPFQKFTFPGGECHIKIPSLKNCKEIIVASSLAKSDEIMTTFLATNALRHMVPYRCSHHIFLMPDKIGYPSRIRWNL